MVEYLVRKRGLFQYLIAVWPVEADGPEIQISAQTQDGSVAIRAKPTKKRNWLPMGISFPACFEVDLLDDLKFLTAAKAETILQIVAQIGSESIQIFEQTLSLSEKDYLGFVIENSWGATTGWAVNLRDPEQTVSVSVTNGKEALFAVPANLYVPDAPIAVQGHGFSISTEKIWSTAPAQSKSVILTMPDGRALMAGRLVRPDYKVPSAHRKLSLFLNQPPMFVVEN